MGGLLEARPPLRGLERRVARLRAQFEEIVGGTKARVLEQAVREIGPKANWIAADAGDKESLVTALDGAVALHGPIDGLFLNAAVNGAFALTPDYSDDAF